MRILLVRLRPIGDVVFTTPLLSALRRHYPEAHIAYVVEPDAAPIVEANPHINDLIIVPRRRGMARIADDITMARQLARGGYDLAIDLHGGPRSAWLTWASGAPKRIGYTVPGRTWMYTEARHTIATTDAAALGAQSVGPACAVGHPATGSGARSAADARQSSGEQERRFVSRPITVSIAAMR